MTTMSREESLATFDADPEAGKIAPTVLATLAEGRATITAGPFTWDADLPGVVGGGNQAPSPAAYLLGALAGCAVTFIHDTLAPEFGVEIHSLTAEVRCAADLAGLFGLDGRDPRLRQMSIDIRVHSSSPESDVVALQRAWQERCPVYLALVEPLDVAVNLITS